MEPTIDTGNILFGNAFAYIHAEPQRGDIILFENEATDGERYIKRIVALPGEHISFLDGDVFIDGKQLIEAYLPENVETYCMEEFDVPEGCYFVMGDNREDSFDSRFWNIAQPEGDTADPMRPFVDGKDIVSKVIWIAPTNITN